MAKIYAKGGTEHTLINAVREAHIRPFQATDWKDLRVGFFVSVCGNTDPGEDDTATGLGEVLGDALATAWTDRVAIGLTDRASATVFMGFTTRASSSTHEPTRGTSDLVTSDGGIGTTNAFFWRIKNSVTTNQTFQIIDHSVYRAGSGAGSEMHFSQVPASSGGYAALYTMRLQRDNATSRAKIITLSTKKDTVNHTAAVLFNNDPSLAILESELEGFPDTVSTLGPIEVSNVPDTFYFYWPFSHSRLRIHAYGILKVA